jgi:predicted DNA-binding transcriptional regulator AlpA
MPSEPILPIRLAADAARPGRAEAERSVPPASLVEPLLVPAREAGRLCGRSEASWWRDHAASRVPSPVRLGGRTLWRVQELRDWVGAGCPDRRTWEVLKAAKNGSGRPR